VPVPLGGHAVALGLRGGGLFNHSYFPVRATRDTP
jgi:hypothetical protein